MKKAIITILVLLLLGGAYYYFVEMPKQSPAPAAAQQSEAKPAETKVWKVELPIDDENGLWEISSKGDEYTNFVDNIITISAGKEGWQLSEQPEAADGEYILQFKYKPQEDAASTLKAQITVKVSDGLIVSVSEPAVSDISKDDGTGNSAEKPSDKEDTQSNDTETPNNNTNSETTTNSNGTNPAGNNAEIPDGYYYDPLLGIVEERHGNGDGSGRGQSAPLQPYPEGIDPNGSYGSC